jgi:hypothetical protein
LSLRSLLRSAACSLFLFVASCSLPDLPTQADKDGDVDPDDPSGDVDGGSDEEPRGEDAGNHGVGVGNKARVLSVAPTYALAEETYKYHPKSNVSEQVVWKIDQGPAGATIADDGASVSWTPSSTQKGKHELVLSAKVGGHELSQTGEVTVAIADERAAQEIDDNIGGSVTVTAPKSRVAGASVYARPASLKSPTRLTISEVDEVPAMGIAKDNSRAVKFGPSGTVFGEPALITLPLSGDAPVTDKSRIGAFVYDAKGRWVRVPVVEVDTEKGVVFAKAKHFSLYAAAETTLGLDVSAKLAPSTGACAGALFVDAWLQEPAAQVDASAIGNLPAELAALSEGKSLADFLTLDGVRGSLRLVRVLELAEGTGDGRVVLETRLLVTTLYMPGDGSVTLTHASPLGHVLGTLSFDSVRQNLGALWTHLSGRAVRGVFENAPVSGIAVSARLHALYFEGDASLDPVSVDDLGFALVDTDAVAIAALAADGRDNDLDCDGLIKAYDGSDDRLMPRIALKPQGVSNGVVGSPVRLWASLAHAAATDQISWRVISGNARLSAVDGMPDARDFQASEPGRFQVEVSAEVQGDALSSVFAIDVSPESALPSCTPSPTASTIKQGESVGLSALLSDSSLGASTFGIGWGVLVEGTFVSSSEIAASGYEARLTPLYASRYAVACRALQGARTGSAGFTSIDVVSAQQNLPPTDLTLSPAYETLLVGAELTLGAGARDPEGSQLHFAWSSSGGSLGTPETLRQRSKVSFSASAPGLYEVRVAVRDQVELAQEIRAFVLVVAAAEDTDGDDADGDGWPEKLDCDDQNARVHPGAADRCGDAIDDDCDGVAKRSDCDGDGFTAEAGDCNDQSREVHPRAVERCDEVDNNCNNQVDEGFAIGGACSAGRGACESTSKWVCSADGFGAVCPAVPHQPTPEVCDGRDNDCDGALDEDYRPRSVECGFGVCKSTGASACVAGQEQNVCTPKPRLSDSDLTCDGRDDDCDQGVDEDVVKLSEVCNGRDDDCDGTSDEGLSCGGSVPTPTCVPHGAEVCNGEDDDCNGRFDENNVCGFGDVRSLPGVYFLCQNAACSAHGNDGFMFLASGAAFKLDTFQEQDYEPAAGPYCVDGPFSYQLNGQQITWTWREDAGQQSTAVGTFVLNGNNLTINWTSAPSDMLGVHELVRVPEQAGGACPRGPICQPTEVCGNGFDDNCNQLTDAADPACRASCDATRAPESCDGLDNDCNGVVDDLNQPCQRADAFGVCRAGRMVCTQGAPSCQAGEPDAGGELCSDGLDNDCDNAVDETGCAVLTPGETCFNAINISAGGVFTQARGERNDVNASCRRGDYLDRMFYISTPAGLSTSYTFFVDALPALDAGAVLYKMPAGYVPGSACPSITATQGGMCLSKLSTQAQFLDADSVYMLVVEASPDSAAQSGTFTLSVARNNDGSCSPGDSDSDGHTICAGDCNDARPSTYPGAAELCNSLDDDCDGLVDEQDGTCNTGLLGVCAVGVMECNQTPSCRPIQNGGVDYCGDNVDNDCDGVVDDNCVAGAGEACDNAIELGNGGPVSGTLVGAHDDAVSRCGGAGPERFYRFTVPEGGGMVRLRQSSYPGSLRFSLYADCALTPIQCSFSSAELPAGTYRLAVETDAPNTAAPYAFTLAISSGGSCLTPDIDGDGEVACHGDCDESRIGINANASEGASCDMLDNDCNGRPDDVQSACAVPGLSGVCAEGELRCGGPQGASSCVQTRFPDAQGRDICADGLDNDCDGASDAQDPQSCTSLPLGETCSLAHQVDISAGGRFPGSLAGYADDVQLSCEMMFGVERFYSLSLASPRVVRVEARAPYVQGETSMVGVTRVASCANPGGSAAGGGGVTVPTCSGGYFSGELPAGTHVFAVSGPAGRTYELLVSTQAVGDAQGTTCLPADSDGDGFTLCNGDCHEGNSAVYPAATEVCDGIDNNCNMQLDENISPVECTIAAALGDCSQGHTVCQQGAPVCQAHMMPSLEICNDGRDNDCDGSADDQGTPGVDCSMFSGESCSDALPIGSSGVFNGTLAGAAHNGNGCYGGTQGQAEERYYRFDATQPANYFVQVQPTGPGPFPEFSFGIDMGTCSGNMPTGGCVGPRDYRVVPFPINMSGPQFLVVESDEPVAYRISIASRPSGGGPCSLADGDGDGLTLCDLDCDDNNQGVHPGAGDICNGRDDNCNGAVDEGCSPP